MHDVEYTTMTHYKGEPITGACTLNGKTWLMTENHVYILYPEMSLRGKILAMVCFVPGFLFGKLIDAALRKASSKPMANKRPANWRGDL